MKLFKTRAKKAEEEAKLEEDYRPTKDLECSEPLQKNPVPWASIILIGSLIIICVICIIVIFCLRG